MGNCCKKADVKPPSQAHPGVGVPPINKLKDAKGDDDVAKLKDQHDGLREQKRRLEEELERWRKAQQLKIDQIEEEIGNLHEQTDGLLKGAEGLDLDDETRARIGAELKDECEEADRRELELLRERQTLLQRELDRIKLERSRLDQVKTDAVTEVTCLQNLLKRLKAEDEVDESDDSDGTDSIEAERQLELITDYYGEVPAVKNFSEAAYQTRVDIANCSSQTIRNIKALFHDIRTGDISWYRERPIRGIVCDMMQCGEEVHDKWDCELCAMMDVTDAPLLI